MNGKIDVKFFNGIEKQVQINLTAGVVSIKDSSAPILKSIDLSGEVNTLLKECLKSTFPEIEKYYFQTEIFSPDFDQLKQLKAIPDVKSLAGLTACAVCEYLLKESGQQAMLPIFQGGFSEYYSANFAKFDFKSLLSSKIGNSQKEINRYLSETLAALKDRRFTDAKNKLTVIDQNSLSSEEVILFSKAELLLGYYENKADLANNQQKFNSVCEKFAYNKEDLSGIYLDFIKYTEDLREEKLPGKTLKDFEQLFNIETLKSENQAYYFYLKGRQSYGRGYFIEALDFLDKSADIFKELNLEEELASVYNTVTNSFTDNLYFEAAEYLANKALEIRTKYNSPFLGDTYSLLGGIAFKKGDFDSAVTNYLKSLELLEKIYKPKDLNRTFNYLAKSYTFAEDYQNAHKYLNLALNSLPKATDKEKSYTYLYQLILAYQEDDRSKFKETSLIFQNPQNYFDFDKFPLGWAFTYLALNQYKNGETENGHQFLSEAIDFFTSDRYYLEAGFVWCYSLIHTPEEYKGKDFNERADFVSNLFNYIVTHTGLTENYFNDLLKGKESTKLNEFQERFLTIGQIRNKDQQREELAELVKLVYLV